MSLFMYLKAGFSFRSSWKGFCNLPHQRPHHKKSAADTQDEGHQSIPAQDEVTHMRQFGMGFFLYLFSMIPNAFGFILRYAIYLTHDDFGCNRQAVRVPQCRAQDELCGADRFSYIATALICAWGSTTPVYIFCSEPGS